MKVAIVTGAGSGIGKSSALNLLKEGYAVVLAGRNLDKLKATQVEAQGYGKNSLTVPVDVCDPQSVKALFLETKKTFGRLDILFNNAGIGSPAVELEEVLFEDWQRVISTNVTGVFLCTQEAFKVMKEQNPQGGRIINNGSVSAHVPRPFSAPYTAAKHAVSGLTKSTNLDGRKYNIACCQIDIGNALTPMAEKMQKGVPQADGSIKVEPTMDVEHVAQAVLYMANLPLGANVPTMTLMASGMPYVGRG